ncbi:MAG: FG-GAP-like repeat-containing protein, partial [Acidobacteriota bacterium]
YQKNNLGVALMEQYKHEEAAAKFREALAGDGSFTIGRINLALALYFMNDGKSASTEALAALKLAPESPQALYVLGAAYKKDRLYPEALASFERLLKIDPDDPYTNIQIGQIHSASQQYVVAADYFRRALAAEPYNATAAYSLAQALIRSGKMAEGQQMLARFQQLKGTGYATTLGLTYGEQGKYAEGVVSTGIEPDLIDTAGRTLTYQIASEESAITSAAPGIEKVSGRKIGRGEFGEALLKELVSPFSTGQTLADLDGDRQLDLVMNGVDERGRPFLRLRSNRQGRLNDWPENGGISTNHYLSGTVAGDIDNDGKVDLALFGYQHLSIWRNLGDGKWSNISAKAGLPADYREWALTAAWVDVDHDGDLDLVVGNFANLEKFPEAETAIFPDDFGGGGRRLFRNNGNGTFTDITRQAGLGEGLTKTTAIIGTDYNNQRDIDLLFVNYGAPVELFSNQRDGSFREEAQRAGLNFSGRAFGVAVGDLNKDNFIDLYFPSRADGDQLFLSNGSGGFTLRRDGEAGGSLAAQMADYDLDGLLDVITLGPAGLRLRRGLGRQLAPGVDPGLPIRPRPGRAFGLGDLNGDGGVELICQTEDSKQVVLQSSGFGPNFANLLVSGRTSNRSALGAKVELRSGSLRQKLEIYAASPAPAATGAIFGLGPRTKVDAVQIFWPAGILQSELAVSVASNAQRENPIEELDRKGTSCPILYAWNGSEYSFVTDFLGGAAFGALVAPGRYNTPDTDEYIRLTDRQLLEKDGRLSLRLNNQLEEVIFFDAVKLVAVDHPAEVEVYPNERLLPGPPFPEFKLYTSRDARPPVRARDDRGNDILPLIKTIDRRYPEEFEKLPFKGYAREHAIELDLGNLRPAAKVLLLMTAWIDYADSTSNYAAAQAGERLITPYLQVRNRRGEWETVIRQMGFPAGLPKTMTVDLTGKFLSEDTRVRIVTGMRIYWDQILVDTSTNIPGLRTTTLAASGAELRWGGFPREYSPDGRRPRIYDYRHIDQRSPWKTHLGNYTRYGDVRELLGSPDDRYVITRNGDELQVDFDARQLPRLRQGWRRTWLLYADGFGKDMDIHSAAPETIGALPYHSMPPTSGSSGPPPGYPLTKRNLDYLEKYNTRTVTPLLGRGR